MDHASGFSLLLILSSYSLQTTQVPHFTSPTHYQSLTPHHCPLICPLRRRYLSSDVAANFTEFLPNSPAPFVPAPCDYFKSKLKYSLDTVAPCLTETVSKPTTPWRHDEITKLRRKCRSAEGKWRTFNQSGQSHWKGRYINKTEIEIE